MDTNEIYDSVIKDITTAIKGHYKRLSFTDYSEKNWEIPWEYLPKSIDENGIECVAKDDEQAMIQVRDGSIKKIDIQHLPQLINRKIKNYLEIGSYIGVSFRILNKILSPDICYSIDPNIPHRVFPKPRDVFIKLNTEYLNKTTLIDAYWIQGGDPTVDSAYFIQSGIKFDLIFIDAMHTYESVKSDFFEAVKILSPDGLILLHDIYTWPGVGKFADEIASDSRYVVNYSPKEFAIDGFCTVGLNHAKNN